MMPIRCSKADSHSKALEERAHVRGENNVDWFKRAQDELAKTYTGGDPNAHAPMFVMLVGGRDTAHMRVRLAQSAARHDLRPSPWSHAIFATPSANYHIPITSEVRTQPSEPRASDKTDGNFLPLTNGVQTTTLKEFASRKDFPNVAAIACAAPDLTDENVKKVVGQFKLDRAAYDALDAMLQWLSFIWSVGSAPNPLVRSIGLPTAALIEHITSACGFDLTPAVAGRASSPEAIWQSAKWWHDYHQRDERKPMPCLFSITHEI